MDDDEMVTAFGRAMLDSIAGPTRTFELSVDGGVTFFPQECEDLLELRLEERRLLEALPLPDDGRVLDLGCGAGRHLEAIRALRPRATCVGVEICPGLRGHVAQRVAPPVTVVPSLDDVEGAEFDLILLLGNGLGVLGDEASASAGLSRLAGMLRAGATIVVEAGNPWGREFDATSLVSRYEGAQDGPYPWGYAHVSWAESRLASCGLRTRTLASHAPGGFCAFVVGER